MSVDVIVRFPQCDAAGIMYYPRYFELLTRYFPGSPITNTPLAMQIRFSRPNRLGDRLAIGLVEEKNSWAYSGCMNGVEHFRVVSAPLEKMEKKAARFVTMPDVVGQWAVGADDTMQLSRCFEYFSDAVEMFMEDVLATTFHEMHIGRRVGIPTVGFTTTVNELPRVGEEIVTSVQALKVGSKSLTLRHQLLRGQECLVENEQVIVFVEMLPDGFQSMDIPDDMRGPLRERLDVAA